MSAKTAKADLHFISDTDRACSPHATINFREVAGGENDLATDARQSFRDIGCDSSALFVDTIQDFLYVNGILAAGVEIASAVAAAIIVGERCNMDPRLFAVAPGAVEFVRTDIDERVAVTVISVFENDDVFAPGVRSREADGKFVGFTAGVEKKTDPQRSGEEAGKALGVAIDVVMQIASVGVKERELFLGSFDHARMAVTDHRHVVVNVEVSAAGVVEKVLLPAADDFQRAQIRKAEVVTEH